jgi:pentatricopeptide repeat protein
MALNVCIYNILIIGLCDKGDLKAAAKFLDEMVSKKIKP